MAHNLRRNEKGDNSTKEEARMITSGVSEEESVPSGRDNHHSQAKMKAIQSDNVSLEANSTYPVCSVACECQACSFVIRAELGDKISCRAGELVSPRACLSRGCSDPHSPDGMVGAGCDVTARSGIVSGNGDVEVRPARARQRCQVT